MRVEAAPYVFRHEDRRQRFADRRDHDAERRFAPEQDAPRASHRSPPWITSTFGAHLLGQIAPAAVEPGIARRAYLQPESRTPLRPSHEETA
jgi:hypothetical protein